MSADNIAVDASSPTEDDRAALIARLRSIVGARNLLTQSKAISRFARGYRVGGGRVELVIRPARLSAFWLALQACHAHGRIVILQAANTGLTGGSTPDGDDYDRPVVVISTLRMAMIHLVDGGRQVVCGPGATLTALEDRLRPLGREPHSVIGSSCIGASVVGGVANNSGGALVRRGPAFTELALFARVGAHGTLELVNHLGAKLSQDPVEALDALERGDFVAETVSQKASDPDYAAHVRDIDAASPSRFNADPRRLFEASGSAGKVAIFAVRLDTFAAPQRAATFYVGANDATALTRLRRRMLSDFEELPVSAEYLHAEAFDVARRYGKDVFLALEILGPRWLPALFRVKAWIEERLQRAPLMPEQGLERLIQAICDLLPDFLPKRIRDFRQRFSHHLVIKMQDAGIEAMRAYIAALEEPDLAVFECDAGEARKAFNLRFAAAGAAIRYRNVRRGAGDLVALDVALRRNDQDWFERLPQALQSQCEAALYYGHFFCHVFHQDYLLRAGVDSMAFEHALLALQTERGARFPAEHNVGHLYDAPAALAEHYRALDPKNVFNPGLGKTSKCACWGAPSSLRCDA